MKIKTGAIVVFEGQDKTGKSTQASLVAKELEAATIHMPSGASPLTASLYDTMEHVRTMRPWTRQLLHLASHEENMPIIRETLRTKGLIMDRWWWSTYAYGFRGAELDTRIPQNIYMSTLATVWTGFNADAVFMFDYPIVPDHNNSADVAKGYEELADVGGSTVIRVPSLSIQDTTEFIINELKERELCA